MGRRFSQQTALVLPTIRISLQMLFFTLTVFLIYLLFVLWLRIGLRKSQKFSIDTSNKTYQKFSIIIAAHNEEDGISETLSDLLSQNYPAENYEIIVVLDRCQDLTAKIVREIARKSQNIELLEIQKVPNGYAPKKYALEKGIQKSKYSNLILMDADCGSAESYLNTINAYFNAGTQILINIPKVKVSRSWLHRYLVPERLLTWSIATASAGHQKPFLAFGTTWAYTKELFQKVGGFSRFSHSLSGDDDLLIYQMGKLHPKVAVCLNPAGWGKTRLPENYSSLFIQRRRHYSAGKYYSPGLKLSYATFHLSNIFLWVIPWFYYPAFGVLLLKLLIDFYILRIAAKLFKEKFSLLDLFIFEIGYFFQHLLIAPFGFIGKIRWR